MNTDNKPFSDWFGYSRRERRSSFILLIILIFVIAFRYIVPQKDIKIEDLSGFLISSDTGTPALLETRPDPPGLFPFDPNSASFDSLTGLGLSERQAKTIINYRNKGGRFRKPSDVKKIYGIDDSTASRLIPYISIVQDTGKIKYKVQESSADQIKAERVDLNQADSAALERLPGLGPVLSVRLIKYRKLLGGFYSVDQLKEVYGLPEETFQILTGRVFTDTASLTRISINDAGYKELSRHPYLEKYDIMAIIKYKELKGRILNINELINNGILTEVKAKRISPYLKF
jgi:competence protein ComEA